MEDYLSLLNEAQQEPTTHVDGPLMVIAGAGSGKTRVLTYRIAYLMQKGIDAFSILALTFTNKAAREMKTRIAEIVGSTRSTVSRTISTLRKSQKIYIDELKNQIILPVD